MTPNFVHTMYSTGHTILYTAGCPCIAESPWFAECPRIAESPWIAEIPWITECPWIVECPCMFQDIHVHSALYVTRTGQPAKTIELEKMMLTTLQCGCPILNPLNIREKVETGKEKTINPPNFEGKCRAKLPEKIRQKI